MKVLVTGGSGVLGRAAVPELIAAGQDVRAPRRTDLDLFDAAAVRRAVSDVQAVLHLATHIPPACRRSDPTAGEENDRLRAAATGVLVDAARESPGVQVVLVPTVAFVYPPGPADESTSVADVPGHLRSALAAEREVARFAAEPGRRGIVLRLGLLYGPGAESAAPDGRCGATLSVIDAGRALAAGLRLQSGIYNVVDPGGNVSAAKFAVAASAR